MLNVQIYSKDGLWEGGLYIALPIIPRVGSVFWLDFPLPEKGHINTAFLVVECIHSYQSTKGYSARLIVQLKSTSSKTVSIKPTTSKKESLS